MEKALLVFCEGAHDVAFVRKIFRVCFQAQKTKFKRKPGLKFSQYPAPFNNLFSETMKKHAAEDMSLDMAHKFKLPDESLVKDDWLILLFNSGGKNKVEELKFFLKQFNELIGDAAVFQGDAEKIVNTVRYCFIYDADHRNAEIVSDWFSENFNAIEDSDWKMTRLIFHPDDSSAGAIADDKALYVWRDSETGKGTLEDIVYSIVEKAHPVLLNSAISWIDRAFSSDFTTEFILEEESISKKVSDRKKAAITAAGQGTDPGAPLSAILKSSKKPLVQEEHLKASPSVIEFVQFISDFSGIPHKLDNETI